MKFRAEALAPAVRPESGRDDRQADERPSLDWRLFRRLFAYTRPHARTRNLVLGAAVLRAMQMPALAWSIGTIIRGPISRNDVAGTLAAAAGFLALAAFTQLTMVYRQRLALLLGEFVVHDLRNELFRHLQRMPLAFHQQNSLGRLFSRCTADVDALRRGIQDVFFVSVVNGGQMLIAIAIMAFHDLVLFGVVLALAPAVYGLSLRFRGRLRQQSRHVQETLSRVFSHLAESIHGIRVTQGFVRQQANAGLFQELADDHSQSNVGVARTTAIYLPLLELHTQLFMALLLLVGGWRVLDPSTGLSVGDLVTFFFLANLVFAPLQALSNQYNVALSAIAGAERVFRLLDTPPAWEDAPDARPLPAARAGAPGARVEFREVHFAYRPGTPVLHALSFAVEPGQTVALIGPTGSGKSTVTQLIGKLQLPAAGSILIDGRDLRAITSASLHRQMGFVTQDNYLFTGTILDNIRFGREDATDPEIVSVCERLGCRDLLEALPAGLQTVVGERGLGLSLGQRQLVCFARALIADPRILILDEATSSIDPFTEARLQRALATLLASRTSFVVAHRLSTIVGADQILVLDHGRLVENGTHASLLSRDGRYANLYRQFAAGERA